MWRCVVAVVQKPVSSRCCWWKHLATYISERAAHRADRCGGGGCSEGVGSAVNDSGCVAFCHLASKAHTCCACCNPSRVLLPLCRSCPASSDLKRPGVSVLRWPSAPAYPLGRKPSGALARAASASASVFSNADACASHDRAFAAPFAFVSDLVLPLLPSAKCSRSSSELVRPRNERRSLDKADLSAKGILWGFARACLVEKGARSCKYLSVSDTNERLSVDWDRRKGGREGLWRGLTTSRQV